MVVHKTSDLKFTEEFELQSMVRKNRKKITGKYPWPCWLAVTV